MLTKLKLLIAERVIKKFGKDHSKEISTMPKWAHVVLAAALDVAAVYVSAKYPNYTPLVAAIAAAFNIPLTIKTYNTVPK